MRDEKEIDRIRYQRGIDRADIGHRRKNEMKNEGRKGRRKQGGHKRTWKIKKPL